MKKSDLKNGMVVELRNGDRKIKIDHILIGMEGYIELDSLTDDLKFSASKHDLDVVKVFLAPGKLQSLNQAEDLCFFWKRSWEPDSCEWYYIADISASCYYTHRVWRGDALDKQLLERGLVFQYKDDAINHAKKLLGGV